MDKLRQAAQQALGAMVTVRPNEQPEPLRLAESISRMDAFTDYQREELNKAAAMLRKLYVHNTELENSLIKKSIAIQKIWKERDDLRKRQVADEALLRQAADMLAAMPVKHPQQGQERDALVGVIKERLK